MSESEDIKKAKEQMIIKAVKDLTASYDKNIKLLEDPDNYSAEERHLQMLANQKEMIHGLLVLIDEIQEVSMKLDDIEAKLTEDNKNPYFDSSILQQ